MTTMANHRSNLAILAAAGIILLAIRVPLFVCAPLGPDPVMYDLQARVVENGGVLYRDILEPNLPGAVWIHLAVRSAAGWSSEALRAFDLLTFLFTAAIIALFPRLTAQSRNRSPASGSLVTGLFTLLLLGGYSTLSEWCHCQRDVWTLPFVLAAMLVRVRRVERSEDSTQLRRHSWQTPWSFVEGALWGSAVWIKPHMFLPAIVAFFASVVASQPRRLTAILKELLDIVIGGMAVGVLGLVWLVARGAWPHLWLMLTEWNPQYVAASADRWSWDRFWSVQSRLAPWSLTHIISLPVAAATVASALWQRVKGWFDESGAEPARLESTAIVASAVYIATLAQAFCFQHLFDYVYVPGVVFAAFVIRLQVLPRLSWLAESPRRFGYAAAACLLLPICLRAQQLSAWPRCFTEGSTPSVRARLSVLPVPHWRSLERVHDFLASQDLQSGELTAYHTHTVHLFPWLGVDPATRFVFTETHLRLFPARAAEIESALANSRQKFVVTSLPEAGVEPDASGDFASWRTGRSDETLARFPFNQPVVFQAGPYLVHRIAGSPGPLETRFFPLAAKTAGL